MTGAALAPGNEATFQEMQHRRPQAPVQPFPQEVLDIEPEVPIQLDQNIFLERLKSAPRGSSAGPGGWTFEHLKVLFDDTDTFHLLLAACNSLAQERVPGEIAQAPMGARLTALTKIDGGVRGIATGCSLRRLVARALAKRFIKVFETRAGTDCVGHMLRAATDARPTATILSVDGIGAYDHVHRATMLSRLHQMPGARAILPFVRLSYAQPSNYAWYHDEGERRIVTQAEGGEQGDPLMPLLFAIGIQGVLEEVATHLADGEQLCAFLDDVYLLCEPARVEPLYKVLEEAMMRVAGIQLNQGKTRAWNQAGIEPDNIAEIGQEVWQPEGITVLGTPVGSDQHTATKMDERIAKERRLWDAIPWVPDLQCAWHILLQSANPRANHSMRTLPPTLSAAYCDAHDAGIWATARALLGGIPQEDEEARQRATLPMRMGGLGLRSAARCAPAAFWASWADSLEMIRDRTPEVAELVEHRLTAEDPQNGCLEELRAAAAHLDRQGFWWRPSWTELREGKRPPQHNARDPGEWPHGWQYWASSTTDTHFRRISMLTGRAASFRAHLRSHSGLNAGLSTLCLPTCSA